MKNRFKILVFFWFIILYFFAQSPGQSIENIYLNGLRLGQQGELTGAELYFKNALAANPFFIPARRALDLLKDFQNGIVQKETVTILFKGMEYFRKSEWNAAAYEFKKAAEKEPGYYMAFHNLGAAHFEDGKNSEAIAEFKKALKINPRYSYTHNNLGLAYERGKNPYEAIKHYKRAIAIDPTYHKVYNNLGVALYGMKKIDEAAEMFRKALKVNPNYTLAYRNLSTYIDKDNDEAEIDAARSYPVEELVTQVEKGDWQERKIAAQALTFRDNPEAVKLILGLMKNSDPMVRAAAAKVLGDMKAKSAVDPLCNVLEEDKDWSVRTEIVRSLGKIKDPRTLDLLHRYLLEDNDYHVRLEAAYALCHLRDPGSRAPLDMALQDRIPEVRHMVIRILAYAFDRNGHYRAILNQQEKDGMENDPREGGTPPQEQGQENLKTALINGDWDYMVQLGEPAVDFLVELIEKGESDYQIDAVMALGYMKNENTVDVLIKQLQSSSADLRFYAAEALGKSQHKKAVPALIELLSDSHWKVRGQAADSLQRITGLYLGDDRDQWQEWWENNREN